MSEEQKEDIEFIRSFDRDEYKDSGTHEMLKLLRQMKNEGKKV